MQAITAIVFIVSSFFVFGLSLILTRNPDGPEWTRTGMLPQSLAFLVTALLAFGISFGVAFILSLPGVQPYIAAVLLFLLLPVSYAAAWKLLGVKGRLAGYDGGHARTDTAPGRRAKGRGVAGA